MASAALLLIAASAVLASCGSSSHATVAPTLTVPTPTTTPTVLYQADWSRGLAGWNASAGWTVVDGVLQSDAGSERSVTIPYQPAGPDYIVEVEIQVVSVPVTGGYYILHAQPAPSANGYETGVYGLQAPGPRPPNANPASHVYIDPPEAQAPAAANNSAHDFNHGASWRVYRTEVRGPAVSLIIDGRPNTQASSAQTANLSTGPLQLSCSDVMIRVRALRFLSAG
jgi:hypothetical protein